MKDYMKSYRNTQGFGYEGVKVLKSIPLSCGYCGEHVAPSKGYCVSSGSLDVAYIYQCPHCKNPIIYFPVHKESLPGVMFGREIKSLPENIQALYNECRKEVNKVCQKQLSSQQKKKSLQTKWIMAVESTVYTTT